VTAIANLALKIVKIRTETPNLRILCHRKIVIEAKPINVGETEQ
jgi:hypothetical protein